MDSFGGGGFGAGGYLQDGGGFSSPMTESQEKKVGVFFFLNSLILILIGLSIRAGDWDFLWLLCV